VDAEQLLVGLNDAQTRAVTTRAAPLVIVAGAGTGKTRVLTHRIAHRAALGDLDPRRVLALTFTRKAAGELTHRLRRLGLRDGVAAGTFHGVAYAQLRALWADRGIAPPTLLDRKVGVVARLLPRAATERGVVPLDVVSEIEWAKARRITPDRYAAEASRARRDPPLSRERIAGVYEAYEAHKRKQRLVDFDDLLRLCTRNLQRDEEFARTQRWRFRHVFVDEYQDVNPAQQALLDAWLDRRTDLCIVGDPRQAIYGWNGADASFLLDAADGRLGGEIVLLRDNYRSTPQILGVANALLAGVDPTSASPPSSRRGGRRAAPARHTAEQSLTAHRPDGPVPSVQAFADDTEEARHIARAVRDARRPGSPWSAQAVLVRTNAQTAAITEALAARGIPFRIRGTSGLLEQPEVRNALRDLQRSAASFDVTVADLTARLGDSDGALGVEPTSTDRSGPGEPTSGGRPTTDDAGLPGDGHGLTAERRANLAALVRLVHDYEALAPVPSVPGLVAWLAESAASDRPDRAGDAVDVLTFHAAKGLEWPVVHLAGLEQGLVPISHAQTAAARAEERNLFYVAVTRAQRELHCSWAERRSFGTRTSNRQPSPYLGVVEAACRALRDGHAPDDWATYLAGAEAPTTPRSPRGGPAAARQASAAARSRGTVGTAADLPPQARPLFEALRTWRTQLARAASMPAYVICNDRTLTAIAAQRPTSTDELLDVPGIGPTKVERYGAELLRIVRDHTTAPDPTP
jgi:DNA helicase-2/ATP-dependent DNA helicase PcrA